MVAVPTAHRIATAARRLLEREGTEAVTMRRVAEAVGITPMAIYRHYPDRAALLNALADRGFDELVAAIAAKRLPDGIEARLLAIAELHLDHALAHPRLYELMFLKPRPGARRFPRDFKAGRSPTANMAVDLLKEAMATGYLRRDDPWEIAFEMGALVEGLIMLYLGGRFDGSAARFRALLRRSLRRYFHGIRR
jgi:AcrR family transcriptional regulator